MSITYLATIDKYLGKYHIFDSFELDQCDSLEKEWKLSQPRLSNYDLLKIFPEAKPAMRRALENEIKQCKDDLVVAEKIRINFNNKVLRRVKRENEWFYELLRDKLCVAPYKDGRNQRLRRAVFFLSALKQNTNRKESAQITDQDIYRAKNLPMEVLYGNNLKKTNATLIGFCPLHNDKRTPNFNIYTQTNSWFCFVCSVGGTTIDFVQKRDSCDFISAVKTLLAYHA